ncbi:MAG: hypothetical protein WCO12_01300 [bacterium]
MKFFRLFLSILFLVCSFVISQQNVSASVVPGPGIEIKNQTEFTNLSFEDRVYKPGDTVKASFTFVNKDSFDYSDISLSPYLEVFSSTTKAFDVYGIQNKVGSYFIPRSSSKVISFEYTIPQSGNITKDASVRLVASVFQGTGASLGPVGSSIKVDGLISSVNVVNAYLKVSNNIYGVQEGPVISSTTPAHLIVKLQNNTGDAISLKPKITIFDLQPSRPEVGDKTYSVLSLKKRESHDLDIELPQIVKPGVYAGELRLFDEKGIERSTLITSRWIIDGDMVTIPSVTIDKTTLKKGEQANVTVVYTGAPVNIGTRGVYSVGKGELKVTLFGNENQVVAEDKKEVDFDTLNSNAVFNLVTKEDVSKLSVLVIALKGEKELARYSTLLTDPDVPVVVESPIKNIIVFSIFSLIVLLLVFFAFFKIKSRKKLPTLFLVVIFFTALFGLGGKEVLAADRACLNGQFCAQGSMTSNLVVAPSADISSNIWNVAEAQVCANGGGQTTMVYAIYDSNNNLVSTKTAVQNDGAAASHDDYNSWVDSYNSDMYWYYQYMYYADTWVDPSDDNSDPYGQRQGYIDFANHYLDLANDMLSLMNNYNQWRTFTGFYPNTANSIPVHIIAPTTPGTYRLVTSVSLFANYRDAWRAAGDETNGGPKTQGPISFQYNFTVALPPSAPTITSTGGPLSCGVNSYTFNWGAVSGAVYYGAHILDDTVRTAGAADCTYGTDICVGDSSIGTSYSVLSTSQTPSCGILAVGSSLTPGQSITSCDGRFKFILQTDGNAVIYPTNSSTALWSSGTNGKASAKIIMQGDGNLVIYNSSGGFIWGSINSTGGHGGTPTGLNMQADGNLVIYATNGGVLWNSGTGGHSVVTLQPGHSYEARAYAYNSIGWSGGSNTIKFSVPSLSQCTQSCTRSDGVVVLNNGTTTLYATPQTNCIDGVKAVATCNNGVFLINGTTTDYQASCSCVSNYICQGSTLVDTNHCGQSRTAGVDQQCSTGSRGVDIYGNWEFMKINSFLSNPSYIAKNNSCTLKYNISNGSSTCSISGYGSNFPRIINLINGSAIGSVTTMPLASSTTYRLSCGYGTVNIVKDAVCRVLSVAEY